MNLLQRVRQEHQRIAHPKAISHVPELAGRQHLSRQGGNEIVQAMDDFADYGTVYSSYAWVQKAVAKIAENLAGLPVRVVGKDGDPLPTHPLTELFAYVNDEQTPLDLWSGYTIHMMLGGEGPLQFVPDTKGRPVEIWGRRPDRLAVVPDASRMAYPTAIGYVYDPDDAISEPIEISAAYMVHDRFYNPLNPWRGLAPIRAVREGITIDLFAQGWSKMFFRKSARPDFAIVAPQGITPSEKNRYEEQFLRDHQGMEKAHLPVILEEGVTDIKTFSFAPKDLEWLEQRRFSRDEVGAIFGVPDEIMGYGKDTYENFQTALEVFWTLTMMPIVRRRDTMLTHHLTRYNLGLRPGERIDTDLSGVGALQEDLLPKAELARKYWEMGVPYNTLDETLKLGMGPIPGGDVGYLASTYKTVDQIVNPPEPPAMLPFAPPAEPDVSEDDEGDSSQSDDMPDDMPDDAPPKMVYLLPEGAKAQAKRALKKLIQRYQDQHLRQLRGQDIDREALPDDIELWRWLDARAGEVVTALQDAATLIQGDHDAVNAAYNALKSDEGLVRLLEVAAPRDFFPSRLKLTHGPITPDAFKALLLQLDPDGEDDEIELRIRRAIEDEFAANLERELRRQFNQLLPPDATDEQVGDAVAAVEETSGRVRDVLRSELERSADLGVSISFDTLANVGMSFDWTLAHTEAARFASNYSYALVRQINDSTRGRLQIAIGEWFQSGDTLPQLRRRLEPLFGERRARLIAQTETTRSAAEGSLIGYRQSEVVSEVEWRTANDGERVCPICGVRHGKRAPLTSPQVDGLGIPGHIGCRCWWVPVIADA